MISQTDATLSPATTTTADITSNHHHHHHHHHHNRHYHDLPSPKLVDNDHNSNTNVTNSSGNNNNSDINDTSSAMLINGKTSAPNKVMKDVKKRKRFEETIVDGFAITSFKSWEDLQDELNERTTTTILNAQEAAAQNNSSKNKNSSCTSNFDTNTRTADKKISSKSSKNNSKSTPASNNSDTNDPSAASTTSSTISNDNKKNDKAKKPSGHHSPTRTKDKRNKSSSEKTCLKRALEEKEQAEKRASILEEKLKAEQNRNRTIDVDHQQPIPITPQHYPSSQTIVPHVIKEETQIRSNGSLPPHEPVRDTPMTTKPLPYSPFHINSQLNRSNSGFPHPMQPQPHPAPSPQARVLVSQSQSPNLNQKHQKSTNLDSHHQFPLQPSSMPPGLYTHHLSHLSHQSHLPTPPPQMSHLSHPVHPQPPHPQYARQTPHLAAPIQPPTSQTHHHMHPHPHHNPHSLTPSMQSPQSPLLPYSHPQSNALMSSMGLGSLPSPYGCPPSIYITDTISRQTSIIPPIGPALEPPNSSTPASRISHQSVLHSISPYNPPVPPHHSMYYPTLPTERSFIEFARSYTGPGHLGYSNLMNSFPTSPSLTANPYSFDRWPRVPMDHQRAVSRYSSLYQSTAAPLPDRTYPAYSGGISPPFPAGLFPPPF